MSQMGQLAGRLGTDHPGCDHQDLQSESWSTSQRGQLPVRGRTPIKSGAVAPPL